MSRAGWRNGERVHTFMKLKRTENESDEEWARRQIRENLRIATRNLKIAAVIISLAVILSLINLCIQLLR